MILTIGGIAFPGWIIHACMIYILICLIQPWSLTFKAIGAMGAGVAYAFLPFVIAGGFTL